VRAHLGSRFRPAQIKQLLPPEYEQVFQVSSCPVEVPLSYLGKVRLPFVVQLQNKLLLPGNVEPSRLDDSR
jgi:hypothetical protein